MMDAASFDRIARAVHARIGRRAALRGLAALIAAPIAAATATAATAARNPGRTPRSGKAAPAREAGSRAVLAPQIASAAAAHRNGQTFITWTERADLAGERYQVFRHSAPITAGNIAAATLLGEVGKGSANVWTDRYKEGGSDYDWRWRYLERAVIENGAAPLAAGSGLLVWTPDQADIDAAASAHYAVAVVAANGTRAAILQAGPVAESVADPRPVLARSEAGGDVRVYIQYMDLREWNPTFHAPGAARLLGLSENDPRIAHALAYAYTYVVAAPNPGNCPGNVVPPVMPLHVPLHGWTGDGSGPDLGRSPYFCGWEIRAVDTAQTWWFGFAETCDFRTGAAPARGDRIANFTEQRVLRMVHDALRDPVLGPRIDPERVYLYGSSMGGSGTLAMASRFPRPFAAAYAGQPMTDYATCGDGGGTDWRSDVDWKWGAVDLDLPVVIRAPRTWADHLQRYAGTGVWSWQDHAAQLPRRRRDDMVPLGVAHGLRDDIIEWPTQGRPFYDGLERAGQAMAGRTIDMGHSWTGWAGLPRPLGTDDSLVPFAAMRAVLSETVPGFASDSADPGGGSDSGGGGGDSGGGGGDSGGGGGNAGGGVTCRAGGGRCTRSSQCCSGRCAGAASSRGGRKTRRKRCAPCAGDCARVSFRSAPDHEATWRLGLEWSASWMAWDGPPVDQANRWRISLRAADGADHVVTVIPRRIQRFEVRSGASCRWTVRSISGGAELGSGAVSPDADGLLVIPGVPVTPSGVRLEIVPA
ncbi:MAG: prolyl oligopeptidase family serine peptidase [Chloroflexota bacterium]